MSGSHITRIWRKSGLLRRNSKVSMSMQTEEITIRVDSDAAQSYRAAPERERRKLDALVSLHLHDALRPQSTLREIMNEISRKAQDCGLTPEIIESILHES
jgi:hypothetical protein